MNEIQKGFDRVVEAINRVDNKLAPTPPSLLNDLHAPTQIGYYSQESTSANRPNPYGVAVSYSSMGHFNKIHNNWINTLAFGTDGRLFVSQSINGGANTPWREIYHSGIIGSRNVAMSAVRAGNAVGAAQPFYKRWVKITDTTPPMNGGKSINHRFNRQKIVGISYRIDGDGFSSCQGLHIEIYDNHLNVESVFTNAQLGNKPLTVFVEYEV